MDLIDFKISRIEITERIFSDLMYLNLSDYTIKYSSVNNEYYIIDGDFLIIKIMSHNDHYTIVIDIEHIFNCDHSRSIINDHMMLLPSHKTVIILNIGSDITTIQHDGIFKNFLDAIR